MKKNTFIAIFTAFIMIFSTSSAFAEAAVSEKMQQVKAYEYSNSFLKNMIKVYAHNIADNFYYGIEDEELLFAALCDTIDNNTFNINTAIEAMIDRLDDEYADYYSPEEYSALTEDVSGEFTGIGVVIYENDNGIVVLSIIEDSPAQKAGILEGDYIVGVDGVDISGMATADVRKLIVGKTDSTVTVNIKRGDNFLDVACTRGEVSVSQTETKMLDGNIAYMRIVQFTQNLPEEVKSYVEKLREEKVSKLIIDLRNNPGGDLDSALAVANTLISTGRLAEVKYRDESKNRYLYSNNYHAPNFKIALLVNEHSASASEFLTTAFRSRRAAKIIGTKTYGKGSMQLLTPLPTKGGMKYTIGEFFSVSGERIHTVGITPDIEVENELVPVDEESFAKIDFDLIEGASQNAQMTLALEQRLEALGYLEEADEIFDENTTKAVKSLQNILGYESTGVAGFYEFLYLNDLSYDFKTEKDNQLTTAIDYLKSIR